MQSYCVLECFRRGCPEDGPQERKNTRTPTDGAPEQENVCVPTMAYYYIQILLR